jgi:sterol desaturase/sphingolipid hydroxylase (fatty acid hydroxylase superfamily)
VLQVAVNILVQQISSFGGAKHMMSRLMHNVVVTYLLSEAHSEYSLPWMSHNGFPKFLCGSPRHEKHHHDGRVYYQQYFKYLDGFFGFTDEGITKERNSKSNGGSEGKFLSLASEATNNALEVVVVWKAL